MPKKDFSQDFADAFELPERPAFKSAPRSVAKQPVANTTQKPIEKHSGQNTFTRRTIYISLAQYNALKLLAATSEDVNEKDMSAIVRSAIDFYLATKTL